MPVQTVYLSPDQMMECVLFLSFLFVFFKFNLDYNLNYPSENVSSVSQVCRKRRLIWAVCWNHRIKRLVPCRCLDGHVKEPYKMSMALGAQP